MNKTLLIIGGVAAVGIVGYMLLKNNKSEESMTKEGSDEQKAADTNASTSTTPSKGSNIANLTPPKATTCGCGAGQTPCPNVRCASRTDITGRPVVSSTSNTSPTRSASTPKLSNETESFAFSLNF
jgi:hypothetical protein